MDLVLDKLDVGRRQPPGQLSGNVEEMLADGGVLALESVRDGFNIREQAPRFLDVDLAEHRLGGRLAGACFVVILIAWGFHAALIAAPLALGSVPLKHGREIELILRATLAPYPHLGGATLPPPSVNRAERLPKGVA